jgi:hypothetical protein
MVLLPNCFAARRLVGGRWELVLRDSDPMMQRYLHRVIVPSAPQKPPTRRRVIPFRGPPVATGGPGAYSMYT